MSLVLIMGLPASGKSTLCEKIRGLRSDVVVFSLDEINGRWSEDFDSHSDRKSFEQTVRDYLETYCDDEFDKIILVDDNLYLQSMQRPFKRMARSFGLRYCCVLVGCDIDEALRRNSQRGENRVRDETILRMAREIEVPNDVLVLRDGDVEQIFHRLRGPRPRRVKVVYIESGAGNFSFLSEMDSILRSAVAEAVHEGLDGRCLAAAKKIVMDRCRQSKRPLTKLEIAEALRGEYYKLKSSGG
ncbi:unnamed protein product [Haemonchus placei]|uniref:L-seryl-tRNA(Sec) kinase n=1 Tax=Haemonchus placei TaxID=6290 RepID=A0A0N4WBY5_HAEPC|nr:unnamed protein product [Haemonchus placei]